MAFTSTLRILCSFIGSISIGKINSIKSSISFNFKNNLSSLISPGFMFTTRLISCNIPLMTCSTYGRY